MPEQPGGGADPSRREQMARLGGDPGRLLRGEDPATTYADDARHWLAVYRELLDFKQELLRSIDERVPVISESAREEVLETDVPLMRSEAGRFLDRIAFWEQRLEELERGRGRSGHD